MIAVTESIWGGAAAASTVAMLLGALAGAAGAQDRELRITVYNNNLGLVSDTRTLEVSSGQGSLEIQDVPALIDPTSVHLKSRDGKLQVLEQNFQYDLASPDRILQRYLDRSIQAVMKEGEVKEGTLLSFGSGNLVLRGSDGTIQLVSQGEIVDMRLPELPEGLRTRPTLVWHLASEKAGRLPLELSYLTDGLNWHAEYVAVTNQEDTRVDLSAWVSLENNSGASYPNARLQLIAGEVQRVQPDIPRGARKGMPMMAEMAAAPGFEEEAFYEYHLYTLDRRTTVSDRETKQVSLFPTTQAPVKKIFEYNGQRDGTKVRVVLETENRESDGLGMPLPAGKVRVYKKDSRGDLQFVGEDRIDHTPRNEKIRITTGKAFDVTAERKDMDMKRISDRVREVTVEVKLRNRKEEPIQVVVQENLYGDWTILQSTVPSEKKDARTVEFRVDVAADEEAVLTYSARIRM